MALVGDFFLDQVQDLEHLTVVPAPLAQRVHSLRWRRRLSLDDVTREALTLWCELELLGQGGRDRENAWSARSEGGTAGRPPAGGCRRTDGRTTEDRPRTPRATTDATPGPGSPAPNSEQADSQEDVRPRSRPTPTFELNAPPPNTGG